jgi:hypothetical protein
MTRTAQQTAKAKATKLHSELVRARGRCQNCGSTEHLQCAHIISRRYANTRTRLDNALCLCARCHMRFTEWPLEFARFVELTVGHDTYDELWKASLATVKVDWVADLERLRKVQHPATEPDAPVRTRGGLVTERRPE